MPIFEFECTIHGRFEKILSFEDSEKIICCEKIVFRRTLGSGLNRKCYEPCQKVWSLPVVKFAAPPTIIFKNPRTGELQVATHANDQPPKGFVREELRGPIERSKFEKEASQRKYVEDELLSEHLKQGREQTTKNIHDDIKARMNAVTNKVYNPETKQDENVEWDETTKAMLKKSMAHSRKKHERIKSKRTNVRLDVNHLDSSNLTK